MKTFTIEVSGMPSALNAYGVEKQLTKLLSEHKAVGVSPEMTALAMSGSSVLVAVNALILKHARLEGVRSHEQAVRSSNKTDRHESS